MSVVNEKPIFKSVLIIGIGLIGGSIAAALKKLDATVRITGIDIDGAALDAALELGYVDTGVSATDPTINSYFADDKIDLIIIATPVSAAWHWLEIIEHSGYSKAITDVASTKQVICKAAEAVLSNPSRYIPGHPMAGSEVNGIEGAKASLFKGAHWILCPDARSNSGIFLALHELITSLGARLITLERERHDEAIAIVSHVPHMTATALVQLAGNHAGQEQELFRLAAGGFKDTTRIAAGSPSLWSGIAMDNRDAVAQGLGEMVDIISNIQAQIENGDAQALDAILTNSQKLRESIPKTWVPDSARLVEIRIPMANRAGVIAEVTGFASKALCNIQSIDIDHINEQSAILELILTDEGDLGRFSTQLIDSGYDVSLRPLVPEQ